MIEKTKKQKEIEKANKSGNPNRILWVLHRFSARKLFERGLNVSSASKLSDKELLALNGIGEKTLNYVREAERKAKLK